MLSPNFAAKQPGKHNVRAPTGKITFLFTDIEGSTQLLHHLADCYVDVLGEHRRLLRAGFQEAGGHEVDASGDGFFLAFANATDALKGALAGQRAIAGHRWPEGAPIRVRVGIHPTSAAGRATLHQHLG